MIKFISLIIVLFTFNSCIVHFVTGNEFEYLSKEEQGKIKKLQSFDNLNREYIYEITGGQLLNELGKHEKSIVYIFSSGCSSESCLPLSQIEKYADTNNYTLFLVMDDFDKLEATTTQPIKSILYAVNTEFYGLEKSRKYMNAFKTDLGYFKFSNDKLLGSNLFFEREHLVKINSRFN